jgi:hypothetical protein
MALCRSLLAGCPEKARALPSEIKATVGRFFKLSPDGLPDVGPTKETITRTSTLGKRSGQLAYQALFKLVSLHWGGSGKRSNNKRQNS